ncbi:myb-binding protein 1A isoform X3 [Pipistrellus kuhlii]|uniref:myb-binding protein 1A isoform X3 n=1 Tax=Pipistrellus kuhlii TaxID=59472 RepID=UPI001E2716C8|nr:myb-binding protein 1A isoform X3 [Pipistrellus kuhlii]
MVALEMEKRDRAAAMAPGEAAKGGARPVDRQGLLQHSREFLDFFWDIAKPQQETRLEATEKLLEYLRARPEGSEMKYAQKRLIAGLGMGRETARPCYSLALAQLLQSFEDIPLCSILQQIQEKHDLQTVKKVMKRPALFANLFGVLALFQSGRLVKDPEALMKSVKLLQVLAQYYNHLQEQPQKALVDILSEVPEAMWQEVLPKVLKPDLNSILGSPEHLEIFLLAQQKVPRHLEKLMGPVNLLSDENIPRLVTVLKTAANSVKKERKLPAVALDLLRLALRENKFPWFWNEIVEQGLMKKQFWPASYLCFRLLGASLPMLSKKQLQLVMRGDTIRHYGEHIVTAKFPGQFKFAPEMNKYVESFLEGCQDDPEKQLAVVVAFSSITNQGLPVVPTFWRIGRLLSAPALKGYVAWLQDMFLQPNLDSLVDFSTDNQKKAQDASIHGPERTVFRLRKWLILRLVSIVDSLHLEKEEALIEEVARFCFFHSFFETKKPTSQIPETGQRFSFPVEPRTREVVSGAFFSLLQTLSAHFKHAPEQTQNKRPWTYRLVQFADMLLNHSRNVSPLTPFTTQQRQAWTQMLQTLEELEACSSEAKAKATAFQHLLLLVGIHLFKSPTESCDLLGDIQTCIKKSLGEKTRRTRSKATNRSLLAEAQEPPWVEVLVEVLLALLAQPSQLIRQVARTVFGHVCAHLTPQALQLILDVLNPEESEDEDDNVVVTDDSEKQLENEEDKSSESEDNKNSESEDSEEEESDEEDRDGDVDPGFREQLMAVLQAGKALGGVDDDDEELGDEAMMALDENLSSLFAEQKLRIQARRDEKNKLQKEKALRRDFQIRVLDLIEVLVTKQPENPLVLELLDPLLNIIRRSMRTSSTKQEQDLLHKTARIFTHHLCRSRHYCRDVNNCVETVSTQVERLVQQAAHQADSSVALYYFNASLYLLRVLKGNTRKPQKKEKAGTKPKGPEVAQAASCLDLNIVTPIYSSALSSFLTKRNSPLTIPMFLSLFSRHPAQACLLLQKVLPMRELRLCFEDPEWEQLTCQILAKVTENLRALGEAQSKSEQLKSRSSLELLNVLFRIINHEKLTVDLTVVRDVLQSKQQYLQHRVRQKEQVAGASRLYDIYWQAMRVLGVPRPKSEKKDAKEVLSATQSPVSMKRKKKGFLPETKKRKKRKSEGTTQEAAAKPAAGDQPQPPSTGKKRKRKKAKAQGEGTPAAESLSPEPPAKTPKLQKNRKLSQVNGATPVAPMEPMDRKHQKELPQNGVSGKSPQSALQPPAKTPKLQKRNRKLSRVNGATPVAPSEPAVEKQYQKELPQKEVSGKSPQSALQPPAKTPKLQKRNRKLSQVNGATPVAPSEPAVEKQYQKELPQKEVSGKSPQSALPRKKAKSRLSLANRSPSLLQSGAKKKKAQLRKAAKP